MGTTGSARVLEPLRTAPDVRLDFIDAAAYAVWEGIVPGGSRESLAFPGMPTDFREGFALIWQEPQLEDGSEVPYALGAHPNIAENGGVWGRYTLPVPIQPGDQFVSRVGFLAGAVEDRCRWALGYYEDGTYYELAAHEKDTNGRIEPFNVELTSLAGKQVQLVLFVSRVGAPRDFEPVWIAPRIVQRDQG